MTSLYAIIIACGIPAGNCVAAPDPRSPYATREECHERVQDMRILAPSLARAAGPGPHRVILACDTLDAIRRVIPGAFEGEEEDMPA